MTNLEELETKIRKLCPELQELSFGCMVETRFFGTKRLHLSGEKQDKSFIKLEDGRVLDVIEILGHPIHLEHILKCLKAGDYYLGDGFLQEVIAYPRLGDPRLFYDLSLPLNKQSEETIAFLNSVIK